MFTPMTLVVASLFADIAVAIPWAGPVPTPAGLIAMAGMSPKPTDAPGFEGIPQELRKRNTIFPPPDNWCGFITGDYSAVLSCRPQYVCANSGAAVGCCPGTTGLCDALYTTCYNYGDLCGSACEADVSIRKCSDSLTPFCGTYSFAGGSYLYNCQTTLMLPVSVEFLNDYYITAIGSSLASTTSDSITRPRSSPAASSSSSSSSSLSLVSLTAATPAFTTPAQPTYTVQSSGLGSGAIGGIAGGVSAGVAVAAGLLVFFCLRRRRRMHVAQSQANARANFPATAQPPSPPVQTEQIYPKTAEGGGSAYQEQQQAPAPQYPATQFSKPAPEYPADGAGFYTPPSPVIAQTKAHNTLTSTTSDQRPFSTATTAFGPTTATSEIDGHTGDHYAKAPLSPAITEVDGRNAVSPIHTGSTPTPAPPGHGPVYEAPPPAMGNGPVYEAPPPSDSWQAPPPQGGAGGAPGYHEVENTQPPQGPWEMGPHH